MNPNIRKSLPFFALGVLAFHYVQRKKQPTFRFEGQKVFITGGSRGLGLAFARRLLHLGAQVFLVARDEKELSRAKEMLRSQFEASQVYVHPADVTDSQQLKGAIENALREMGGIDVLINNAGSILVGPFAAMEKVDFEAQMKLHLYSVIEAIQEVTPHFKAKGGGRILNVCSLGGKVGVPHMAPYDASKFALAGFAQGVRSELKLDNIFMTTAFPTVMRTGSPIQAVFKGNHEREFKIFETIDNLPLLSMSADAAAEKMLNALAEGRSEIILSIPAKIRLAFGIFMPETLDSLMSFATRFLPRGESRIRKTGADSTDRTQRTKDEIRFNQETHHDAEYSMGVNNLLH